jgi:MFS family permease
MAARRGRGFALQSPCCWPAIFLLGLQSTLFGPVKYAYLPQHLNEHELTGGNGMVEMGTFVAILLGTIGGGLLIGECGERARWPPRRRRAWRSRCSAASRAVRAASPATDPGLRINWNPFTETWPT